jgi:Lar family restriction alleviation protein
MGELKPCPLCGGKPTTFDGAGTKLRPAVSCADCPADMTGKTLDEAIAAWNRRALSTQDSANGLAGDLIQAREARDRLVQALGIAMGALQTIQGMEPVTHEITLAVVMANHATDALNDIKALAALAQPAEDGR